MDIQQLLEKGLYYYGLGEIDKAIELWREVLRLDPHNETAREYIEIETGRSVDAGEASGEEEILEPDEELPEEEAPASTTIEPEFLSGQQYLHRGEWENAMQSFEAAHFSHPSNPVYWAYVELSKSQLIKYIIEELGGFQSQPRLTIPLDKLAGRKNFTQEEGFVLSLITGDMSLEDLIALSPLPRFQSYLILHKLLKDELLVSGSGP